MALERSIPQVDLSEESQSERLARKSKEAPYVPIGTLCYNTLKNRNTNKHFSTQVWQGVLEQFFMEYTNSETRVKCPHLFT